MCLGNDRLGVSGDLIKEPVESWPSCLTALCRAHPGARRHARSLQHGLEAACYSLNSTNPEEIRQARDLLLRQRPLVKGYNSSNFEQDLAAEMSGWPRLTTAT